MSLKAFMVYTTAISLFIIIFLSHFGPTVSADIWFTRTSNFHISCKTDSMAPTFTCHDNLTMATPKDRLNLSVGQIIIYGKNKQAREVYGDDDGGIVHRIVSWEKEIVEERVNGKWFIRSEKTTYYTKGDNNNYIDPYPIDSHDIWYVVTSINGNRV